MHKVPASGTTAGGPRIAADGESHVTAGGHEVRRGATGSGWATAVGRWRRTGGERVYDLCCGGQTTYPAPFALEAVPGHRTLRGHCQQAYGLQSHTAITELARLSSGHHESHAMATRQHRPTNAQQRSHPPILHSCSFRVAADDARNTLVSALGHLLKWNEGTATATRPAHHA